MVVNLSNANFKVKKLNGQKRDLFIALYVLGIPVMCLVNWCSARYPYAWGFFTLYNLVMGFLLIKATENRLCVLKKFNKLTGKHLGIFDY